MNSRIFLVILSLVIVAPLLVAGDPPDKPLTGLNIQVLGPQRLGNLSPVPIPPDNPQSSAKILLG
jgi:hypothetical protein